MTSSSLCAAATAEATAISATSSRSRLALPPTTSATIAPGSGRPLAVSPASARSSTSSSAATTVGSNWVPAQRRSSASASSRGERPAVGAVAVERVPGVAGQDDARGERDVLAGEPVGVAVAVPALVLVADGAGDAPPGRGRSARIRSPMTGCSRITCHSSASSGPGLCSSSSGMPILPTSCSSATAASSAIACALAGRGARRRRPTGRGPRRRARRCSRRGPAASRRAPGRRSAPTAWRVRARARGRAARRRARRRPRVRPARGRERLLAQLQA